MKKFLLISPKNRTVYNFRGDLIRKVQSLGYEVLVTGPNHDDMEGVEKLGVRFVEVPMDKTGTSPKEDLTYLKALTQLMRKECPDVVLGYTSKPVIYGCLAARAAGVKNINALITGGGYTFTATTPKARMLGKAVRTLYRSSLRYADHVLFQNHDDRTEFVSKRLVDIGKTHVVHGSGVNMQHFTPQPYPTQITFACLSRLLKSKGVREYLAAARIVKQRHPEVLFLLLGKYETDMQDGIPREEIESFEQDGTVLRLDETADVRPLYEETSVYVLPSYREGMPRTVLEAMACARPIITTDTYGCRETIDGGLNGFLVPVGNVEHLVERMEYFIEHPDAVQEMGAASLQLCELLFDVDKVNDEMVAAMGLEKAGVIRG